MLQKRAPFLLQNNDVAELLSAVHCPTSEEGVTMEKSAAPSPKDTEQSFLVRAPELSLPKGGGAIRGIGEKFSANPVTGTGAMSVPIALSPGRGGFGPQLALGYDSGAGHGAFALGWQLALPSISRKTDKGLPRYGDEEESDVFLLSGVEDLVPVLDAGKRVVQLTRLARKDYNVRLYRPRIEGLFARIERWSEIGKLENAFWRTLSRDNIATWYGRDEESRIADPDDPTRIFQWLICQTHDDKGNVAVYGYAAENSLGVDTGATWEANRRPQARQANRYLKRILYGGATPYLPVLDPELNEVDLPGDWMFEAVFDYGDHSGPYPTPVPDRTTSANPWPARVDAFSTHRSGFEVRTYRLCRRVLMFHHFRDAPGVGTNCLVRSTEFEYELPDAPIDVTRSGYTVLRAVTHRSYQRKPGSNTDYEWRGVPPVAFTYSRPVVDPTVRAIDAGQLDNLPVGIQGPGYQWIDLDGEGLSGALAERSGAWYYKPNLGGGRFGTTRLVVAQPTMALAAGSRHQFMDLAGDGEIDVVDFSGPAPGFHERDRDEGWKRHVPFVSLPNIDWQDPNLRFVDLTGDGHADALITEQEVFTWYPSLDERGFAAAERTRQARDEDAGPRLVFADGTQTIFLADMCGDGLTALVRIRNGQICYWPNLGYGRFGRKVTLGNSPRFDHSDLYDPRRIRLTDIDGSGPVDIIYLGRNGAQLYFNRSGNSLSDARLVDLPVATENLGAVQAADLLGNGTACLVWNSHLPADERRPVCYIDLMGGANETQEEHCRHEKPHLLIEVNNNLGGSTEIEYTPSTRFYLQDRQAGTPWITRLPFPVHCVSKVTVRDRWRGTAFSSTYSYHHGYFDGAEREFRGFGRVEQIDVESYGKSAQHNAASPYITQDQTLYQPPVKTITWYHTGAAADRQHLLDHFEHEYFPRRFAERLPDPANEPNAFHERVLPEPQIPPDLTAVEWREALRACKGMVLRQEVYALDVEDIAAAPARHTPVRLFSAATHNCHIQRLQARGDNLHAVFLVTESEALSYHYELALPKDTSQLKPDPRIAHTLNLRHDELGNPQQSIAIGYGRWQPGDHGTLPRSDLITQVQGEVHVAYSETRYSGDVVLPKRPAGAVQAVRDHRLRLPCEVRSYEITGLAKPANTYFDIASLRQHALCEDSTYLPVVPVTLPAQSAIVVTPLQYHEQPKMGGPHRRIVEHARTRFFDDGDDIEGTPKTPTAALTFGQHGPRGLKYEDYKLALTDELLQAVFTQGDAAGNIDDKLAWDLEPGTVARSLLDTPAISGYIPGTQIDAALTGQYWMRSGTAGFDADAARHFYLPERYTDSFNNTMELHYDALDLYVESSKDAHGNETQVQDFDFRVLTPRTIIDTNGNHTQAAFDIRGQVVAVAVKGKQVNGRWEGDHLDSLTTALVNVPPTQVMSFCTSPGFDNQKQTQARLWLADASTRFVYHFGEGEDAQGHITWATCPAGACAITREQHVGQLAAGGQSPLQIALECSDGSGNVLMKKVQAEPDPQSTAPDPPRRWIINGLTVLNNKGKPVKQYEPRFVDDFGCQMPEANGVTPVMYYDAAGRLVRTEFPDGTFSRVEFSPWNVKTFDQNDTVLGSAWYQTRNQYPPASHLPVSAPPDQRAVWLAARHANTPALTVLDSLGREVIAIAHNRVKSPSGMHTFDGRRWKDEHALTYTKLDAEGKPLWIRDARGNLVMQYLTPPKPTSLPVSATQWLAAENVPATATPCYDIAGNLLYQHSMDAGDRWMLMDAAGKPMLAWDFNERQDDGINVFDERRLMIADYDGLHRPTALWLRTWSRPKGSAQPFIATPKEKVERFEYQDAQLNDSANLNGQAVRHFDPSGRVETLRLDFKGNVQAVRRRLVSDAKASRIDWAADVNPDGTSKLEGDSESYTQITEHDALGRMTRLFNWHRPGQPVAVYEPTYNARGALFSEDLVVRATKTANGYDPASGKRTTAIAAIHYNAKGQKTDLALGNGTLTQYEYDTDTFRLRQIFTTRPADKRLYSQRRANLTDPGVVQDLNYTYDPVGNITECEDQAYKPVFWNSGIAEPRSLYEYDALYRLVWAQGRETAQGGDAARDGTEPAYGNGFPVTNQTLRRYTQLYEYDAVGNFITMRHRVPSDTTKSWTRHYETAVDSNRLLATWQGSNRATAAVADFLYDLHGSMRNLGPVGAQHHLRWDHRDMIRSIDLGGGGGAWYQYDSGKQRTRKRIENQNGLGGYWERIYLGGYELYRRYNAANLVTPVEEIESLHLFEGEQRVLLVDDVIRADANAQPGPNGLSIRPKTLFRYQYGNHLGSVGGELDETARVISYEEFHPYGTTAYRLMDSFAEAPAKRYRYTGMERDEENGLVYLGARFLQGSLGRWVSGEPSVRERMLASAYCYCHCSPINQSDPQGLAPGKAVEDTIQEPDTSGVQVPGFLKTKSLGVNASKFLIETDLTAMSGTARGAANVASEFEIPSRTFLGTGGTGTAISVTGALRGIGLSSDIRVEHFSEFSSRFGRPKAFSLFVIHEETVAQLRQHGQLPYTLIGEQLEEAARGVGLRVGSWKVEPGSHGFGYNVSGRFQATWLGTARYAASQAFTGAQLLAGKFIKAFGAQLIPGYQEISQFGEGARFPFLSGGWFLLRYALRAATSGGSLSIGQATAALARGSRALAASVATRAGATGAAVLAAAGSFALLGFTAHAAATDQTGPIDIADRYYGTGFGNMRGWFERSQSVPRWMKDLDSWSVDTAGAIAHKMGLW
ncbi:SpvB/TcaC N-terminal domain-containing protein [Variovorax sp. J22R133]|uniref:SpvB/TcaC N-terminal domain-containing protein n=1 Tax=Variovorax brevis TaxID=3053503 RepID=UPI002574ED87|nr:SpvB/TcaC N-terminal domain-containing protein [Variovorax sp. J22R133]MDM0116730.1 SpvB/TcaC N-terminal domain-containing protein [Variovorax sp. J22R133]